MTMPPAGPEDASASGAAAAVPREEVGGHGHRIRWDHHLFVTLFVASIVVLTQPVWLLFDNAMATAAYGLLTPIFDSRAGHTQLSHVAVVKINEERFANPAFYAGTSPLDRCMLERDLRTLLSLPVRILAVDLDLSPSERGSVDSSPADPVALQCGSVDALQVAAAASDSDQQWARDRRCREDACQRRLDDLLTEQAARLILMRPSKSEDKATDAAIQSWAVARRHSGVVLGNPVLYPQWGFLRRHALADSGEPDFGAAVRQRMQAIDESRSEEAACEARRAAGTALALAAAASAGALGPLRDAAACAPGAVSAVTQTGTNGEEAPPAYFSDIAFHVLANFHNRGRMLTLDQAAADPLFRAGDVHTVIFGAGYSADDEFLTPLGPLHGVDVHAALAACELPTVGAERRHHVWHLAVDLVLGTLIFGPLLHWFWHGYYETRIGRRAGAFARELVNVRVPLRWYDVLRPTQWSVWGRRYGPKRAAHGWFWLLWMMASVVLLAVGLVAGMIWLFANFCAPPNLLTGLVIGLAIEAAVFQSPTVAVDLMRSENAPAKTLSDWFSLLACVYLAVVAGAGFMLFH